MAIEFPLTFQGVPYAEMRGSGEFVANQQTENSTTRIYRCEWSRAYEFAARLVGFYVNVGGGLQTYSQPHRDPERPFLFAETVAVEGLVMDGQDALTEAIKYKSARLTVTYSPRTNDSTQTGSPGQSITFLTEQRQASVQALTIPEDKLVWASGPKNGDVIGDDAVNFVRLPQTKITITISYWFDAPTDLTFEDAAQSVNENPITILQTTYPEGKLRFDHGSRTRQFTSNGLEAWQINLEFMYRREEWNKLFDPDQGGFEEYETASGDKIHEDFDFTALFPVGLVT